MIKPEQQQQIRIRDHVRGGEGELAFHDFLLPEESFGAGKMFSRTVLPAGASIGEHRHDGEFEVYYILSGEAEVLEAGEWATIRKGGMHLCKSGESHAIRNNTTTDAEVLMLILYENPAHI